MPEIHAGGEDARLVVAARRFSDTFEKISTVSSTSMCGIMIYYVNMVFYQKCCFQTSKRTH